ncbi:hypothetical protein ANN_04343 [Periplaneta americana]|uniref:Uncharacterized protein n=1 Tax=Periplaneta americana TaxID=6978 RepID=A0ABQ8T8A6_PERAM|nr:hypothetical protein ANN_04343 [Periplaneta americana]
MVVEDAIDVTVPGGISIANVTRRRAILLSPHKRETSEPTCFLREKAATLVCAGIPIEKKSHAVISGDLGGHVMKHLPLTPARPIQRSDISVFRCSEKRKPAMEQPGEMKPSS